MANWNKIMEAYESNDCESLGEYAAELMLELGRYYEQILNHREDVGVWLLFTAMYFVNVDRFLDGGEEDVLRYAINDVNHRYDFWEIRRIFNDNGYTADIEDIMHRAPQRIREVFARLGCAVCSGKGYISEDERRTILRWV